MLSSAFRFLSIRPRSELEIVAALQKKSTDQLLIEEVVNTLKRSDYLNDEKFAQWMVESLSRSNPKGKTVLIQKLKLKGIQPDIIEKVIRENFDDSASAEFLLSKKSKNWTGLSKREFTAKAARLLYSRGFTWTTIEGLIKKRYN